MKELKSEHQSLLSTMIRNRFDSLPWYDTEGTKELVDLSNDLGLLDLAKEMESDLEHA